MSGIKYVLKNNTTLAQFFDYKTLSDAMWNYQVQLNPGQIKTIWAETGTLKIYNNGAITIEEQSSFPPTNHVIGGNNTGNNTYIDYMNKSILIFSVLPNSTNLGYSILNFDGNVIYGPVDLGYNNDNVDGGNWYVDDIFPFTNSGYVIYLYTNAGTSKRASIYLDYSGQIIGEYSAATNNTSYNMLNGKFACHIDYDNNMFNYSDGKTYKSRSFDGFDYMFGIPYYYWDGNIDNGFVVFNANGNVNTYILVTMEKEIPLTTWSGMDNEIKIFQYSNSNFITTLNYNTGDTYTFFNIYSSTGSILQTIDLTLSHDYNNFDLSYFGTNKLNIVFYNDGDTSIPFLIYTYDGETDTLISTTHPHTNYSSWDGFYDTLYGGDSNFPSQDFHLIFYTTSGSTDGDFYELIYCSILSYFNGDTEFRNPHIVCSGNTINRVSIYTGFLGSSFIRFFNDNNGFLTLLVITSEVTSLVDVTQLNTLDTYNFGTFNVGDTFIFTTYSNYSSAGTFYAYDSMGNQLDYKLFYGGFDEYRRYGTFYFETDPGAYYFNTKNSQFVLTDYYYVTTPNIYYTETFEGSSNILLIRYDMINTVRLLSEYNFTPEVILPLTYYEPTYLIGKDVILYLYFNENNNVVINLYNTSFGLLQSITTPYNSISSSILIENRAWVQFQDGGTYINYMVSANGIKMVESTTNNNSRVPNDYYWWND
jgi:hypothetical protein